MWPALAGFAAQLGLCPRRSARALSDRTGERMTAPAVGERICGELEIVEYLAPEWGCAGLGSCFRVLDHASGSDQHLTIVDGSLIGDEVGFSEFMMVAHEATKVSHPKLARCVSIDREFAYAVVVHEWLPGAQTLAMRLGPGTPDPASVMSIALDVALALENLHKQGMVHGCLTPENIWLWEDTVRLAQFAIVPACCADGAFEKFVAAGSERVAMPPELMGLTAASVAGDVYAWGLAMTMYARGSNDAAAWAKAGPDGLQPMLGPAFVELLLRACSARPGERPRDASIIVHELRRLASAQAGGGMTSAGSVAATAPAPALVPSSPAAPSSGGAVHVGVPSAIEEWSSAMLDVGLGESLLHEHESLSAPGPESLPELESEELDALEVPTPQPPPAGPEPGVPVPVPSVGSMASRPDFETTDGRAQSGRGEESNAGARVRRSPTARVTRVPTRRPTQAPTRAPTRPPTRVTGVMGQAVPLPEFERPLPKSMGGAGPHGPPVSLMIGAPLLVALGFAGWAAAMALAPQGKGVTGVEPGVAGATSGVAETLPANDGAEASGTGAVAAAGSGKQAEPAPAEKKRPSNSKAQDERRGHPVAVKGVAAKVETAAPCPDGSVAISKAYCIDVAEYPRLGAQPLTSVTRVQAELLCSRRKGRLCSASEWVYACRGGRGWTLPHARRGSSVACNSASAAGFAGSIQASGAAKRCRSPRGVFDMVGNAGEWVADSLVLGADVTTPRAEANCQSSKSVSADHRERVIGFRCCYDR